MIALNKKFVFLFPLLSLYYTICNTNLKVNTLFWHGVKVGPGPTDQGESPQSLKVEAGTPVKFKSGTPGPTSKFKRRTLM